GIEPVDGLRERRHAEREAAVAAAEIEDALAAHQTRPAPAGQLAQRVRPQRRRQRGHVLADVADAVHCWPGSIAPPRPATAAARSGSISGCRMSSGGSAPAYHHTTSRFARKSASNTESSGLELRLEYHQNQSEPSATMSGWRTLFGMLRSGPH